MAIEPPELEMRVAIVLKKAEVEAVPISEEIAFFIAKNIRSNVRELEGALKKVLAFARFTGREMTLEMAREALRDILHVANRQISVDGIQKTVAEYFKIKISDMHSKKRSRNVARPHARPPVAVRVGVRIGVGVGIRVGVGVRIRVGVGIGVGVGVRIGRRGVVVPAPER